MKYIVFLVTCEELLMTEHMRGLDYVNRVGLRPGDYAAWSKNGFLMPVLELRPEGCLPWEFLRLEPNFRKYYDEQLRARVARGEIEAWHEIERPEIWEEYIAPEDEDEN